MIDVEPPPPGHEPAPGYILHLFDMSAWFRQDGHITDNFKERGIWDTPEAAAEAMERFLK